MAVPATVALPKRDKDVCGYEEDNERYYCRDYKCLYRRGRRQSWSGMWHRGLGGELGWEVYLDHRESRAHGCGSLRACSTARQSGPDRADNIGRVESSRDNGIAQRPETVEEGLFSAMHFQQVFRYRITYSRLSQPAILRQNAWTWFSSPR